MSAPAYARPQSLPPDQEVQKPSHEDVSELAYALWQQRGCPDGSPEEDWFEAENWLVSAAAPPV